MNDSVAVIDIVAQVTDETASGAQSATSNVSKLEKAMMNIQKQIQGMKGKSKLEVMATLKDMASKGIAGVASSGKKIAGKIWTVTLKAKDLVTAPFKKVWGLVSNPIASATAFAGVTIGAADTINTFKDFESAMSQVKAVSGASGKEFDKLTEKAKEMGATTKFTAKESADAFNYMAMAGWKSGDMLGGIEGIMNLAAASGEDLATTSDIVTDALTAFGLQASDATHFADVLAQASSNANTNVGMLGESFKYVAPVAGAMKYSVEDVSLALGLMANASVKGSMAGTSLKTSLANMASPTNKMAAAMKKYGISLTDSNGNMKSLKGVMDNLRDSLGGLSETEQTAAASRIFGKEAMAGMLSIINATEKDYKKLTKAVNNADGASNKMADTMMDNLSGSLTYLQSALDGVKIAVGNKLSPYVKKFVDWLTGKMPQIQEAAGNTIDFITGKIDSITKSVNSLTKSPEWKNAETLWDKVELAWDKLIAEPFDNWWNSSGKTWMSGTASSIGEGLGSAMSGGILALLGVDVGGIANDGIDIGKSLAKGFAKGFDGKEVADAIGNALKEAFKTILSSASKLLPGGEKADIGSILSAALLAKVAVPAFRFIKGAIGIGKAICEVAPEVAGTIGATSIAGAAGGVIGATSAISGAVDAYHAIKSDNEDEKKAYGTSAGLKIGGVAAGAAVGTAILPGLGTAIGAGVGGIAGLIGGNKVTGDYKKEAAEVTTRADKLQELMKITGRETDELTFKNKNLQAAMKDTEVSAEDFSNMFQTEKLKVASDAFGDISLSMTEVQEAAKGIALHGISKRLDNFSKTAQDTEASLTTLKNAAADLSKANWKAGLGIKLNKSDQQSYKATMDSFVQSAKDYVENSHYEAAVSMKLLMGKDADMSGLDTMYSKMEEKIGKLDTKFNKQFKIAIKDGVINADEQAILQKYQDKISKITNRLASAQTDAEFDALKIKFTGAALNADSFSALQQQIATDVQSATQRYDDALTVTLTNLNLELDSKAINQRTFDALRQEAIDGYNNNLGELTARVEAFNIENISEVFNTELQGIDLDVGETIQEKLTTAMNQALSEKSNVESWTQEDIIGWFGLDNLDAVDASVISDRLQATAEAIPQGMLNAVTNAISEADMSSGLQESVTDQLSNIDLSGTTEGIQSSVQNSLSELDFSSVGTTIGTGMGEAIQNTDMEPINSAISAVKSKTDSAVNSAFSAGVSATMPAKVTLDYSIVNPTKTFTVSGPGGTSGSTSIMVSAHADGGIMNRPHFGLVAEDGAEAIIPLSGKRRNRGIDLWEKAGQMLGIKPYAEGGIVGNIETALTTQNNVNSIAPLFGKNDETSINPYAEEKSAMDTGAIQASKNNSVNIPVTIQNVTFEINVSGNETQNTQNLVATIRENIHNMTDEIAYQLAIALQQAFANTPTAAWEV